MTCQLNKYKVTRQTYFKCFQEDKDQSDIKTAPTEISPALSFNQHLQPRQELMFMIFQDTSLFGDSAHDQANASLHYTDLNQATKLINYDFNTPSDLTSQVAGFILNSDLDPISQLAFNVTLEIKMPDNYYTLLRQIESKLINRTHELNGAIIEKTVNSTVRILNDSDLMSRLRKLDRLVERGSNPFERVFRIVTEDAKQNALLKTPLNYSNDAAMSRLEFELNEFDLNDSVKVLFLDYFLLYRNTLRDDAALLGGGILENSTLPCAIVYPNNNSYWYDRYILKSTSIILKKLVEYKKIII